MTDTDHIQDQVTFLLDALIPRRDERYASAHAFAVALLTTDPSTQRLVRKALKLSPAPEQQPSASPPTTDTAPAPGDVPVQNGAAAPHAEETPGNAGIATRPDPPGLPSLSCGGRDCYVSPKFGKEVHPAQSCPKFAPKRVEAPHAR